METSKWAYKKKVTPKTRGYFPRVYSCPKCGIEYQTTPPSQIIGSDMVELCPDCGGSYVEMPEGYGISPDGYTQSLETIAERTDRGCFEERRPQTAFQEFLGMYGRLVIAIPVTFLVALFILTL